MRVIIAGMLFLFVSTIQANVVNVFVWSDAIPDAVIQQFEKETGIKVNFNTYESTETLVAKLRATSRPLYDVIEPTSYYVDRMRRADMLEELDKTMLPNIKHIDPYLMSQSDNNQHKYAVPYIWGMTGIFINTRYHSKEDITSWKSLWNPALYNQLALIDDSREIFSVGLAAAGHSINSKEPDELNDSYLKLIELLPNIKVFGSDLVHSLIIDEDATIGVVWNGDVVKARWENKDIDFVFPDDGPLIWVDCLAIAKNAPNKDNAYKFIDFLMRPDIAKQVALAEGYTIANLTARELLPDEIKNDPIAYPPQDVLERSLFQGAVTAEILTWYGKQWTLLKLQG